METPPPTVGAKDRNSQHVEAVLPTRIEGAVLQTSETTSSRTGTRTTPDKSRDQATSSSAIGSSGGEHADKPAEAQGKNIWYSGVHGRMPRRKEYGRCRVAERADRACHEGGADGADDAQCKYHAVEGTANHVVEGTASSSVKATLRQPNNERLAWEFRPRWG